MNPPPTTQGDTLIIGAGLAGLTAAWQATARGHKVRVIAKGWGATHWLSGCIDVLGYYPLDNPEAVRSPARAIDQLIAAQPDHPYARIGKQRLAEALIALKELCGAAGYPLHGSLERNWLLPSAVGAFRPTCLAPEMMLAGDLSNTAPMLIVGFRQLRDFYPALVADNLRKQGVPASHFTLDLTSLEERHYNNPITLARMMEDTVFRSELVAQLQPHVSNVERVGFPAVLGVHRAMEVKEALENRLRRPVFEIPSLTPSVPGIRLHRILLEAVHRNGGRVFEGLSAESATSENGQITSVYTSSAGRSRAHRFDRYLLATGGILGGGIDTDYQGHIREVIFNLPVRHPADRQSWFRQAFLDRQGHPIYRAGLAVNDQWQATNGSERPVFQNLYVAGTTLAGCEYIRERSFEGIAIGSGYAVAVSWQNW